MTTRDERYPFADIDLARRLERTEARSNANFIEARVQAFPDLGAQWIEVAGAYAMFDGVGSPVTQTFGLGMFQPLTTEDLDRLEEFFQSRGADVFHEVCPLADQSVFTLINERGYRPVEFSNVLYRPITPDLRLNEKSGIKVRLIDKDDTELWAQTAFEGWREFTEIADYLRDLGRVTARSKALRRHGPALSHTPTSSRHSFSSATIRSADRCDSRASAAKARMDSSNCGGGRFGVLAMSSHADSSA